MNKLSSLLNIIKSEISQNKKVFIVTGAALVIFLSIGSVALLSSRAPKVEEKTEILGIETQNTPRPTEVPTPTDTPIPTSKKVAFVPTNPPAGGPTPTPTSVPSSNINPSPTPTPTSGSNNNPTSTPTPTTIPTPSDTPTPTPVGVNVQINIDYAGAHLNDTYTVNVNLGTTAWSAIQKAMGVDNLQCPGNEKLQCTDYGGDLGIFISGFNGVVAAGNQYYEFRVNGVSSNVGVSSYVCNNNDVLEFVLTSF